MSHGHVVARSRRGRRATAFFAVFFIAGITLMAVGAAGALAWAPVWERTFAGPAGLDDSGIAVARGPHNEVYVVGEVDGIATVQGDVLVVKYAANGSRKWTRTYAGPGGGEDEGEDVVVDRSGNVIVLGNASIAGGEFGLVVAKYTPAGSRRWARIYDGGGTGNETAGGLAVDRDGNVYVCGSAGRASGRDGVVVKYSSSGVRRWTRYYDGSGTGGDYFMTIGVDGKGNVYVAGSTYMGTGHSSDWVTAKYSSGGVRRWARRFNGGDGLDDWARDLTVTSAGTVFVSGSLETTVMSDQGAVRQYDTAGHFRWMWWGGGASDDSLNYVARDPDGRIVAAGSFHDPVTLEWDFWTVRLRVGDGSVWQKRFGGIGGNDNVTGLAVDGRGRIFVCGGAELTPGDYDWLVLRYDSNGVRRWERVVGGVATVNDRADDIAVLPGVGVAVTGNKDDGVGGSDVETVVMPFRP